MSRAASRMMPELTRGVGPWAAIAVNVTNMIGAGVFLKTRVMTCNVGGAGTVMLVWIAAGKSNRDISEILRISPRTVNKHLE